MGNGKASQYLSRSWGMKTAARIFLLTVAFLILTFTACELAIRAYDGQWRWGNSIRASLAYAKKNPVWPFDPALGWRAAVGDHGDHRIHPEGWRMNGNGRDDEAKIDLLVAGDSFAFGFGVPDQDAWPAILERKTGLRVANFGVPAYGLDQAILMAQQQNARLKPKRIVIGMIPHDIERVAMSRFAGRMKPRFDLRDGAVVEAHAPLEDISLALDPLRRVIGHSHFLRRFMLEWSSNPSLILIWYHGLYHSEYHPDVNAPAVACAMTRDLARQGTPLTLVMMESFYEWMDRPYFATDAWKKNADDYVACAARLENVEVIDLRPSLRDWPKDDAASLFRPDQHFTPLGNEKTAQWLIERSVALRPMLQAR